MATVERRQFCFSQPLNDCQDSCVNEAQRKVTVAVEQFPNASVVLRLEVDDFKQALLAVSQKAPKSIWTKTLPGKPVQLDDHRRRDEHLLVRRF